MSLKIGIVGKMGSGKTTAANYICTINNNFYKDSFANKLKEIACDLFNMKTKNRKLLIDIGSKMREIDKNVWINYTLNNCSKYEYAIIDDVRYLNEYFLLRSNNWKIIKLNISDDLQKKRLIQTYPDTYQEHLKFIKDLTEEDAVNLDDSYFDLVINVDENNVNEDILKFLKLNIK